MTLKAVYWDMDGTLVDSEPLHDEALSSVLGSLGITPPADLHERVLGQTAQHVYRMMREEFDVSLPFDEWIARKYDYYLAQAPKLKPRVGALEIFRELDARGVVQAVVSNSDRLVVDANLRAVGIQVAGMKTISRNDVLHGKPNPEPFLRAAMLTGIEPAQTAVMEDSWTGATAGVAAGMRTVFWPEKPMEGPDGAFFATSADDVRRLLGLD